MKSLSTLEDHTGFWLRTLSNQVSGAFAGRIGRQGVSVANWVVLRVLHDHRSLALKDIVSRVGVDQGSLSRLIDRMVARGLVSRKESPASRREVSIALTAEGRRLVPTLAREADENDRAFFGRLGPVEERAFLATIKNLIAKNPSAAVPVD